MTENQTYTYQAMFLLDNQEVRKGFNAARDWLKSVLEKHGIQVRVLRLWGERPLAYTIRGRRRATYLLGWLEAPGEAVAAVKRDLYLVGPVFRSLFLREEAIPEDELAYGIEEVDESAFVVPEDGAAEGEDQNEAGSEPEAAPAATDAQSAPAAPAVVEESRPEAGAAKAPAEAVAAADAQEKQES